MILHHIKMRDVRRLIELFGQPNEDKHDIPAWLCELLENVNVPPDADEYAPTLPVGIS